jgi:hypothetical protein
MFYYLHPQKSQLMQEQERRDAESVQALQRFLDARAARCGDGG